MPSRQVEQRLLRRARRGDGRAMEEVMGLFQGPLQSYLVRLCGDRELAEDLTQETFVRVLGNLDRFDDRFRFSTWLFTIGRRLWMNHLNKLRPRSDSEHVERSGDAQVSPGMVAVRREQRTRLRKLLDAALAALTPSQREMVLLYHQQEMGVGEIARRWSLPEGTVKSHLFRARRRMLAVIRSDASDRALAEEVLR
jgi:RNA polymerase sigma-70 factor (ECF subfamily)